MKKRDNLVVIKAKMERTFSHRHQLIVEQKPMIEEIKIQWPAHFQQSEVSKCCVVFYFSRYWVIFVVRRINTTNCCVLFFILKVNSEFMQITTKPLQSTFLSELDHFSDKLMQILKSKGGVKGQKIKNALAITDSVSRNACNVFFIVQLYAFG